jgi:tetratricopeptide (TPR) repeat protein
MRVILFILVSLVMAQGACAQAPSSQASHYLEKAFQEVLDGRPDLALQSINKEIENFPDEARAYRARATLLLNCLKDPKTYARALQDYDQALKLEPQQDLDFYYQRARLLARMDQPGRALIDLDKVVAADPEFSTGYFLRARCHYAQAEYQAASADLDRTLELAPRMSEAYGLRGVIRLQAGQRAQGISDLEKALALDPRSSYRPDLQAARSGGVSPDGAVWASYVSPDGDFQLELPVPVRASIQDDHLVVASALKGGHMYGVVRYERDDQSKLWKIESAECRKAVFQFLEEHGGKVVQWDIEPYLGKRCLHARMQSRADKCETDTLLVLGQKYIYLVACVRTLKSPPFDSARQHRFRRSFRLLE